MHYTLCFTGMDRAEEAALKIQFSEANDRLGNAWKLVPEEDAQTLVVDVDSIYGHMTWLKVHNSGRTVVALSSSAKAEADHVLVRPVTAEKLTTLLGELAAIPPRPAKPAAALAPPPAPVANVKPEVRPAPAATRQPEARPAQAATPQPEPPPAAPPREPRLIDLLQPGVLPGPMKFTQEGAPDLLLDPVSQSYAGSASLKPLAPYATSRLRAEDGQKVNSSEFERVATGSGGTQPYLRLAWLCALTMGNGQLAEGLDPNGRYKLGKWPQTEREFPRHFRIATVMMKGPATLTEIAEASGASLAEVTDFVNASLVTGVAESEQPVAIEAELSGKGGLLGRLRGLRGG